MSCVYCARTLKVLDSFITQGDKEEMVTEMVEELVCWLFYCIGYHFFLVSLRYERIEHFQSPSAINTRHGIPGLPAIYWPLYPCLVFSSVLPRLIFDVVNKNDTIRVTIKTIFTYQVCDKLQSYAGRKPFDFMQSFVATLYNIGHSPLLYY